MKHYIGPIALLTALVQGIESTAETAEERSVWVDAPTKYPSVEAKSCATSADCVADHVCAQHAWAYNGQYESAQGCWHKSVCKGTASYLMFDGRQIQWFCSQEDLAQIGDNFGDLAYPLNPADTKHWDMYEEACNNHQDCITRSGNSNQRCTAFLWDGTEDGNAYGAGTACYSWDREVCPGPTFAIQNQNYVGT